MNASQTFHLHLLTCRLLGLARLFSAERVVGKEIIRSIITGQSLVISKKLQTVLFDERMSGFKRNVYKHKNATSLLKNSIHRSYQKRWHGEMDYKSQIFSSSLLDEFWIEPFNGYLLNGLANHFK